MVLSLLQKQQLETMSYRCASNRCARQINGKSCSDSVCQELGMDSAQKVDCDPVIKSGVTMHLYKKSN